MSDETARRIRDAQVDALLGELTLDETLPIFYLSFVDPEILATIPEEEQRPGGPSWKGACFVPASDPGSAVAVAHLRGCNPGGQVQIYGPIERAMVDPEYVGRLLTDPEDLERAQA